MNSTNPIQFKDHLLGMRVDAVMWKAERCWRNDDTPDGKQKAVIQIAEMLSCISNEVKREYYMESICSDLKIKKNHLKNSLKNKLEETEDLQADGTAFKLPNWCDKDRVYNYGMDWQTNEGEHTGYYFTTQNNNLVQMTNFVLTPLYHLHDTTGNSRRLAILHNGKVNDIYLEMPTKAFISVDFFETTVGELGHYQTLESFGKPHLKRLFRAIGEKFPKAYELKVLGYQPEGFWSYADQIFDGENLIRFNNVGIAKYKSLHYYSPASSPIYLSQRKDEDGHEVMDDDPYENDKFLRYHKSPVNFEQWAMQMMKMHKDEGMPLIAYAFISLFKDIIVAYEKCPILYGYGLVQSGKSTWAEGLYYLFYNKQSKPFNLNQGTVYAFFNRMERFRNCPQLFNEFDEDAINDEFFRAFKAFYDGEGRDRGKGIRGKTETQKINCTVILIGQTLTTKDGASVLIRSIPVKFDDPGERTDEEKRNYDEWNGWTNTGMNSCITDALQHRKHFKQHFFATFNEELVKLKTVMREESEPFKERIAKNYCIMLACSKIMLEKLQLGFTYQKMFDYCRKNIVSLSRMISEVDNLAIFWKTVQFLLEKGDIQEGVDFRIVVENHYRKSTGKETITIPFDQPKQVLYLRLTKVYPFFAQQFRMTTGNRPINERTLITYFESSKPYLGNNPGNWFDVPGGKRQNTSSHMFDYKKLNITLEVESQQQEDLRKPVIIESYISQLPQIINTGTVDKLMFSVKTYRTVNKDKSLPETITEYVKCFTNLVDFKDKLLTDTKVKLMGMMSEKIGKNDTVYKTLEVETIDIVNSNGKTLDDSLIGLFDKK